MLTFAALFVSKKREKRKEFLVFFKRHLIRQPVADTFCPCLGDADRVRLRESVNSPLEKANSYFRQRRYQTHARHALSAGVQTMRARICSVFSCAMFARVVV